MSEQNFRVTKTVKTLMRRLDHNPQCKLTRPNLKTILLQYSVHRCFDISVFIVIISVIPLEGHVLNYTKLDFGKKLQKSPH